MTQRTRCLDCLALRLCWLGWLVLGHACTRELPVVDDDPKQTPADRTPDKVVFDVDWNPTTVVVPNPAQLGVQMSSDQAVIEIAHPTPELQAMAAGHHVLLSGVGLYQVKTATAKGEAVSLAVEPGTLLDAASSGTISWDVNIASSHAIAAIDPVLSEGWIADKADPAVPPAAGQTAKNNAGAEFSGTYNGVKGTIEFAKADDKYSVTGTLEIPAAIPFSFSANAEITMMRLSGGFKFGDQMVEEYVQHVNGIAFDGTFSFSGGGKSFDQKFSFPVGLYVPVELGPVPAYVGLSAKFTLRSTLESKEDGKFTSTFRIHGNDGLSFKDGQWSGVEDLTVDEFKAHDTAFNTIANSAIGVVVELPRVSVGVGTVPNPSVLTEGLPAGTSAPTLSAGLYGALQTETVQNIVIGINNAEKVYCRFVDNNAAFNVGGEIKAFKLSISKEVQAWFRAGEATKDGPGCAFLKHP
jgi:hypothetical protein